MSPVQGLTMTLMTIDARIKDLYSQILTELDEAKRTKDSEELLMLKVPTELKCMIDCSSM